MVKQYRCVCWAHSKAPACLCGCLCGWHESVQGRRKPGEIRHPWGIPRQNPSPSAAFAAGPPPESHESTQRRRFRVRRAMKQPKGDAYSRRMPRINPRETPPRGSWHETTQGRRILPWNAARETFSASKPSPLARFAATRIAGCRGKARGRRVTREMFSPPNVREKEMRPSPSPLVRFMTGATSTWRYVPGGYSVPAARAASTSSSASCGVNSQVPSPISIISMGSFSLAMPPCRTTPKIPSRGKMQSPAA